MFSNPEIEFLCYEEDLGIIPEPYSARKFMPDWFKKLPPKIDKLDKLDNSTIKRCMPFLDAMSIGYIIPLVADVEFVTNEDASGVSYKSKFHRPIVENHGQEQIAGHGSLPKPPMKFLNYWAIKVPNGYSVAFMPPLNRKDSRFECISGVVDCDGYFEFINFPFFFNEPNFTGILEAGTPLVQVIPFKRDKMIKKNKVRAFNSKDLVELERTRAKRRVHESHYRNKVWEKK